MRRGPALALAAATLGVALLTAGCGGGNKTTPQGTSTSTTATPTPLRRLQITVVDGDTGEPISGAAITAPGTVHRGARILIRRGVRSLTVTVRADRYTSRTLAVIPAGGPTTVEL